MNKVIVRIKEGQIQNPRMVRKAFTLPDGSYELTLKKANRRSLSQNAYYWSAVVPMIHEGLRDLGHDVNLQDTHEFLKARFNSKEIVEPTTGEMLQIPQSTTEMNKEQFGEYVERISQFAAEYLNITIPSPNSQIEISYEA